MQCQPPSASDPGLGLSNVSQILRDNNSHEVALTMAQYPS